MGERPYTLLSCAVSADGYLDDAGPDRLLLSNDEDLDRVDAERAAADAILVGANTIRRDDPRLLVRSATRETSRRSRGLPLHPVKVTLTAGGGLSPSAHFFTTGETEKLVYAPAPVVPALRRTLAGPGSVTVVDAGETVDLAWLLGDLARRGVRRLLVEGGGRILTGFLTAGLADELHLVVAPFFVGDPAAPRFSLPGRYPNGPARPMRLAETRRIGDLVLLDYLLGASDARSGP